VREFRQFLRIYRGDPPREGRKETAVGKLLRTVALVSPMLMPGMAPAETVRNWAAPNTWAPPARSAGPANAGLKSGLVTTYPAMPFIPVTPCRLADTRAASGFPPDYGPPSLPGVHAQRTFPIWGQCGIPGGASAVSFNFTVWAPVTRGDLRVFPAFTATPNVATLNWEAGILALANAAVVALSSRGEITVQVDGPGTIDLIIDVNGYYSRDVSDAKSQAMFLMGSGPYTFYAQNIASGGGWAVVGNASGGSNARGVVGFSGYSGVGVYGEAASGVGVEGISTSSAGVLGHSESNLGVGGSSTSAAGIAGSSTNWTGVVGLSSTWDGISGLGGRDGVFAQGARNGLTALSTGTSGVHFGVFGSVASGGNGSAGVHGEDGSGPPTGYDQLGPAGVVGTSSSGGVGVLGVGRLQTTIGGRFVTLRDVSPYEPIADVYLANYLADAAVLFGNVWVNGISGSSGDLHVAGSISKGGGSFLIDHPLDPENKYLYHSFVESPDMMNVYNGVAELGPDGSVVVKLPTYFQALNKDFRYQLTALGMPQPQLHVALEIENNEFLVAGGKPHGRVSWQVTGIRKDRFGEAHRIVPEVEKESDLKGYYLHPAEHGQPAEKSLGPRQLEVRAARLRAETREQPRN
jgi:hypothetical protein